jgi:hypothetical protein
MAEAVIFAAVWPSVYVMFFVSEPLARMPFLLMVTVVLLAGSMSPEPGKSSAPPLWRYRSARPTWALLAALVHMSAP